MIGDPRLPARFWNKVTDTGDCWLWTGAATSRGYGSFIIKNKTYSTHRVCYQALVGSIPSGFVLDHLCEVKRCCNPAHLDLITRGENNRRHVERHFPSHCVNGHEWNPANLIRRKQPGQGRLCRLCKLENERQRRARRRAERQAAQLTSQTPARRAAPIHAAGLGIAGRPSPPSVQGRPARGRAS